MTIKMPKLLVLFVVHYSLLTAYGEVKPGHLCHPKDNLQPDPDDITQYYRCVEQVPSVGEWTIVKCANNLAFSLANQTCILKDTVSRQQSLCQRMGEQCADWYVCTGAVRSVVVGQQCSWLTAGFQSYSTSLQYYYQCQPVSAGNMCGQWQLVSCPNGYTYDATRRVCVLVALQQQSSCLSGSASLCRCYGVNRCPVGYACVGGVCCTSGTTTTGVLCPDGLTRSTQACTTSSTCSVGFACNLGGCCRLPTCTDGRFASQFCTGTGQSTCLTGFSCVNGGCCVGSTVAQRCPDNTFSAGACTISTQCQIGFQCSNGMCCPQTVAQRCPDQTLAAGTCTVSTQCNIAAGFSCQSGLCCTQAVTQRCPDQTFATGTCVDSTQCTAGRICLTNLCCVQSGGLRCQDGTLGQGQCQVSTQCGLNQVCQAGLCCASAVIPRCPDNTIANQPCTMTGQNTCPAGFSCQNSLCCPIPARQCLDGTQGQQPCNGPGIANCPAGFYCTAGDVIMPTRCCRLPTCSNGQTAVNTCVQGLCPNNFQCIRDGCCPTGTGPGPAVTCPDNQPAQGACTGPGTCPGANQYCFQSGCCNIPRCTDGSVAVSPCNAANPCPAGQQCLNGGCCPQGGAAQTCPFGGAPIQVCSPQNQCPARYTCVQGNCCLENPLTCPGGMPPIQACTPVTNTCPTGLQCVNNVCCPQQSGQLQSLNENVCAAPIVFCGSAGQCPFGATCTAGICCATSRLVFDGAAPPGALCSRDSDCSGGSTYARCVGRYCSCANGARSSGVACVPYRIQYRLDPSVQEIPIENSFVYYRPLSKNLHCSGPQDCVPNYACQSQICVNVRAPSTVTQFSNSSNLSLLTGSGRPCNQDAECSGLSTCDVRQVQARNCEAMKCRVQLGQKSCACSLGLFVYNNACYLRCPFGTRAEGSKCVSTSFG